MHGDESSRRLSDHLVNPMCSRHDHVMSYEKDGISWKEEMDVSKQNLAAYHCGYQSCTVRYAPGEGYFTVVDAPDIPRFIEEPGVNLYTCPHHRAWLYQSRVENSDELVWRCGIENCRYSLAGSARSGAVDHPNV